MASSTTISFRLPDRYPQEYKCSINTIGVPHDTHTPVSKKHYHTPSYHQPTTGDHSDPPTQYTPHDTNVWEGVFHQHGKLLVPTIPCYTPRLPLTPPSLHTHPSPTTLKYTLVANCHMPPSHPPERTTNNPVLRGHSLIFSLSLRTPYINISEQRPPTCPPTTS